MTKTLRNMKPGDMVTLPASAIASVTSSAIPRLRKEFFAERKDWKILPQDQETGNFTVLCFTRES